MSGVLRGVLVAALIAALVTGVLWSAQRRLIYFPSQVVPDAPTGVTPVDTTTEDGLDLQGWLVGVEQATGPLVIVFHGNGGNWADRLPLGRALSSEGLPVLLAGYRGYGGNPGAPTQEGLEADARAWHQWAQQHHDGDLAYYGESLGTGVAVGLAAVTDPVALVLRSPFTSLADAGRVHYPWLPLTVLLRDRFPILTVVGDLDVPILVVLGTADGLVPPEQSRAVHRAAAEPAGLVEVPGARHNDRALLDGEPLIRAVTELLRDGSR
ncbi:alpha/beta hydrolase [soil metagenome]